jgi:leucyl/phenylalanyl-tRNA--protein transferase
MIPVSTLLAGYRSGYFPMAVDGRIGWFSPTWRGVLPLDRVHVPRRLQRVLRHHSYEIAIDRSFGAVMEACASRPDASGNWIDDEIIESYRALHAAGYAHSVEVWSADRLVGGLYGVSLRGAFFGESMFHYVTDASKIALCALVDRLNARGFVLLDIQWLTTHLEQFGAVEVSRPRYLKMLDEAMKVDCQFG